MAVVTPPLYLDVDSTYGAEDLGLPYRDLLSEGVIGSADATLKVAQRAAGANMSVDVGAGACWVLGDDATTQPLYRCYNDATVNLVVTAADPTNPRIDRVIAEVRDATFSGAFSDWRLRVVAGTPAGSPAAPAVPNNAISLATVAVAAAAASIVTANITDARTRASAGGGDVQVSSALLSRTFITAAQAVTATSEATSTVVITSAAITCDGTTPVRFRVYSHSMSKGTTWICPVLWDSVAAASVGQFVGAGTWIENQSPLLSELILTPAAGSHTFSLRAFVDAGTGSIGAGPGGAANDPKAFLEILSAPA